MGSAKILLTDKKGSIINDFMIGNGKGYAKDNLTRQVPGQRRQLAPSDLEDLYSSNSMAANIIDIPAEDMTRSGWTIKMKDEKLKALYESRLRQLKTKDMFKQLNIFDRLYGDGFISLGLIQKSTFELSDAIKLDDLKKISYLNAFSSKKVNNRVIDEDVFSPRYGKSESFEINNRSRTGIEIAGQTQVSVHHSRLIHQQSTRFEDEIEGTSLLESLYDILTVMDTSLWSVGQIMYDFVFKVFKSKDIDGMNNADKAELGMLMDYKFRTEALAVITNEEELGKESTNVSGINQLLDFTWDYLAGAARMPKTVLKGQEAGTLTGAQYDVMNYYSRIASMQENSMRPQLEYLVRLLMWCEDECGGRIDPDSIEWSIEFNPLWSVDSKTDAEIRKLTAESDKIYIESGVLDPSDVQEARFGRFGVTETSKFNADSATDIDKLAESVYKKYKENRADG